MAEQFEQRPGSGILFKNNKKKAEGSRQPDYSGHGKLLDGTEFQVSAWIKEGKSGAKFLSLGFQPPYVPNKPKQDDVIGTDEGLENWSNDIPF